MDRVYLKAVIAASNLEAGILLVVKNRNFIGNCSYKEAELLKNLCQSIDELEQQVQDIIRMQHEMFISHEVHDDH